MMAADAPDHPGGVPRTKTESASDEEEAKALEEILAGLPNLDAVNGGPFIFGGYAFKSPYAFFPLWHVPLFVCCLYFSHFYAGENLFYQIVFMAISLWLAFLICRSLYKSFVLNDCNSSDLINVKKYNDLEKNSCFNLSFHLPFIISGGILFIDYFTWVFLSLVFIKDIRAFGIVLFLPFFPFWAGLGWWLKHKFSHGRDDRRSVRK